MRLTFRSDEQKGVWFVKWNPLGYSSEPYDAYFIKDYDEEVGYGFWNVCIDREDVKQHDIGELLTQLMLDNEMGNKYCSQGYSDVGYQKDELTYMLEQEARLSKSDIKGIKAILK